MLSKKQQKEKIPMVLRGQFEHNSTEIKQTSDKFKQNLTKYLQNLTKFNELPAKKQSFLVYYICTNNATQSAISAGYSEKTAGSQASRLLKDVNVAEIVNTAKTQEFEEAEDDKAKMIATLDEIINDPSSTANERINAIKTKAMLLGLNAPNKNQFLGKDGQPVDPVGPTIINKTYVQKN